MPLVSIVIPVYKAEDLLPRCLDSILAQTMLDWECVMVDDGSPDGSGAVCDRYAAQDSRFKVIHKVNEGGSIARNVGVENACGKWLYFVDNDDVLAPGLLEAALKQQETSLDSMVLWNWCDRADQLPPCRCSTAPPKTWANCTWMRGFTTCGTSCSAWIWSSRTALPIKRTWITATT